MLCQCRFSADLTPRTRSHTGTCCIVHGRNTCFASKPSRFEQPNGCPSRWLNAVTLPGHVVETSRCLLTGPMVPGTNSSFQKRRNTEQNKSPGTPKTSPQNAELVLECRTLDMHSVFPEGQNILFQKNPQCANPSRNACTLDPNQQKQIRPFATARFQVKSLFSPMPKTNA